MIITKRFAHPASQQHAFQHRMPASSLRFITRSAPYVTITTAKPTTVPQPVFRLFAANRTIGVASRSKQEAKHEETDSFSDLDGVELKTSKGGSSARKAESGSSNKRERSPRHKGRVHLSAHASINSAFIAKLKLLMNQRLWKNASRAWKELKEEVQPDLLSYTAMLNCYAKQYQFEKMNELLAEMKEAGIHPDEKTYNVLMDAYANKGQVENMLGVFSQMKTQGLSPTVSSYNTLMNYYKTQGQTNKIVRLYDEIQRIGLTPDVITFTILISAFGMKGDLRTMNEYYLKMKAANVTPGLPTYVAIMEAYGSLAQFHKMSQLLALIKQEGFTPTIKVFNTMMAAYATHGQLAKVKETFELIKEHQCTPNLDTFNAIFQGFSQKAGGGEARVNEMMEYFDMMNQFGRLQPDLTSFTYLIGALAHKGDVQKMEQMVMVMKTSGMKPSTAIYHSIIEGYVKADQHDKALRTFQEMKTKGAKLTTKTFDLLIYSSGVQKRLEAILPLYREMTEQLWILPREELFVTMMHAFAKNKAFDKLTYVASQLVASPMPVTSLAPQPQATASSTPNVVVPWTYNLAVTFLTLLQRCQGSSDKSQGNLHVTVTKAMTRFISPALLETANSLLQEFSKVQHPGSSGSSGKDHKPAVSHHLLSSYDLIRFKNLLDALTHYQSLATTMPEVVLTSSHVAKSATSSAAYDKNTNKTSQQNKNDKKKSKNKNRGSLSSATQPSHANATTSASSSEGYNTNHSNTVNTDNSAENSNVTNSTV